MNVNGERLVPEGNDVPIQQRYRCQIGRENFGDGKDEDSFSRRFMTIAGGKIIEE